MNKTEPFAVIIIIENIKYNETFIINISLDVLCF